MISERGTPYETQEIARQTRLKNKEKGGFGHVRTEEKGYRIENVSKDELQRQLVDAKPAANPGEQTVNCGDE
jgi:hypothetical protein